MLVTPFLLNQAIPYEPNPTSCPDRVAFIAVLPDPPSRFRRKKGYTGPTAQYFNKNYKTMPKDF